MLVKYTGKADQLIGEYDGKRYVFSKKNPIIEIPIKVYDYIKASRGMRTGDIMPHVPEAIVEEKSKTKPANKEKTKGGKR